MALPDGVNKCKFGRTAQPADSTRPGAPPTRSASTRTSGTERPTTNTPSENRPDRNGLENDENNMATDVTIVTFISSSHSALTSAASTASEPLSNQLVT